MDGSVGLGIGSGLARGLANVLYAKRQQDRERQNKLEDQQHALKISLLGDMIQKGIDPNLAIPAIGLDLHFGEKPPKGQPNHNEVLQKLLSPVAGLAPAGPEAQPQIAAGAPAEGEQPALPSRAPVTSPTLPTAAGPLPWVSPQELAQRQQAIEDMALRAGAAGRSRLITQYVPDATPEEQRHFILTGKLPTERLFTPGTLAKGVPASSLPPDAVDAKGNPIDKTAAPFWDVVRGPKGENYYIPGAAPTGGKVGTTGMSNLVREFVDTALVSKGIDPRKASDEDIVSVFPEASRLARDKIGDQDKLRDTLLAMRNLQEQVISSRQSNLPTDVDLQQNARTITLEGKPYKFVSKGSWSGADAQNAAAKAGPKAGVLVVNPQEASQLDSAQATLSNLDSMFQQIKDKLPESDKNRPLTSLSNKLSQFFQSDDQLAAFISWDLEVVPMLKSLQMSGRITNVEFVKALDARPKITDTAGTAVQKLQDLKTQITNSVKPILERSGGAAKSFTVTVVNPKTGQPTPITFESQAKLDAFKRLHPEIK